MRLTWRGAELRLLLPTLLLVPLGFAITNIALTGQADPGPTIAAIAMAARMALARERNCAPAK